MNPVSKIILGFVVIAVFAVLWVILAQKNKGGGFGCGGNCSGCGMRCDERKEAQKDDKP